MIRSRREEPKTVNPFDGIDFEPRPQRPREMPAKLRLFAEAVAAGAAPAAAWKAAGYQSAYQSSRAMLPAVQELIARLQAEHAERNRVTVDTLLEELEKARKAAMSLCQISAAIAATMGKAKLLGMLVDRSQSQSEVLIVTKPVRQPTDQREMTVEKWIELYQPPMKQIN